MTIQSTKAVEKIAVSAFNATSDKDSAASNAFAALFGQAYAQQASQAAPLPTAATQAMAARPAEAATQNQAVNVRTPDNEPVRQAAQGNAEAGADAAVEGMPKSQSASSQKKATAQSDKKEETGNADAAASAMALNQQQASAVKTKSAATSSKTAAGNTADTLQALQGKRLKKATEASESSAAPQLAQANASQQADAAQMAVAAGQAGDAARTLASTKPQASADIKDALAGKSSLPPAMKPQAADSAGTAMAASLAAKAAGGETAQAANAGLAQDALKPVMAEGETLPVAPLTEGKAAKADAAQVKLADLPEFNRVLAAQSPAQTVGTASTSTSTTATLTPATEGLTDKAPKAAVEARTAVAGNLKEALAQTGLREEALRPAATPMSSSVSDAAASAKPAGASKAETSPLDSPLSARGPAAADRPRFSNVGLQQAASVQSSGNASNVTMNAVEGLESKVAVPQNTGLQAAGLSVFQSIQRQDEPLKMEIATPITQPGFTEELTDTVKLVSTRDLREVEVTINPEELGPIKLKVQMNGDKAEVTFQAENEQTRTLLAEAVPALTESLAESGIDLRNAMVEKPPQSLDNNTGNLFQGQSNREQRNPDANFQQGQNRNGRQDNAGTGTDNTPRQPAAPRAPRNNGLLDTYA